MFDIGFWELCLIATVALLVLGPERLPIAARTAGKWVGKIRSMVSNVKSEIDRELQLDEIRRKMAEQEKQLREQSGIDEFKETIDQAVEQSVADIHPLDQTIHTPQQQESIQPSDSSSSQSDTDEKHDDKS